VIKPAAQIRHPSRQQPSAGNASNVHPVNPRAHRLDSGQQAETVQNRHAVRLQSQGGANLRRSLRPLHKRHPRRNPAKHQAGRQSANSGSNHHRVVHSPHRRCSRLPATPDLLQTTCPSICWSTPFAGWTASVGSCSGVEHVPVIGRLADRVQEPSEDLVAGPLTLFGSTSRPGIFHCPKAASQTASTGALVLRCLLSRSDRSTSRLIRGARRRARSAPCGRHPSCRCLVSLTKRADTPCARRAAVPHDTGSAPRLVESDDDALRL
jgi:hypothetical protein